MKAFNSILAIVVDEAHCIVKKCPLALYIPVVACLLSGDQFQTVYANIAQLKSFIPTNTTFLALTAMCNKGITFTWPVPR